MNIKLLLWQSINKLRSLKAYNFSLKRFGNEFAEFGDRLRKSGRNEFVLNWSDRCPILNERTSTTSFDAHYVYHPAWAARILAQTRPSKHVDISSSLHFCTIISAFVPVDYYEYRPVKLTLSGLDSKQGDLLSLPFANNSVESLSCMHVVEHIGLGRYGDPIDPDGDLKAMDELIRVLAPDGMLLFVVPVGKPRICFNAHRIYDPVWIKKYFEDRGLSLDEFAIIPDNGSLLRNQMVENFRDQIYACGCYAFRKVNDR